jgi:hypothetical protein
MEVVLKCGKGYTIGTGKNVWDCALVSDLADAFILLMEEALKTCGGRAAWWWKSSLVVEEQPGGGRAAWWWKSSLVVEEQPGGGRAAWGVKGYCFSEAVRPRTRFAVVDADKESKE